MTIYKLIAALGSLFASFLSAVGIAVNILTDDQTCLVIALCVWIVFFGAIPLLMLLDFHAEL